MAQWQCMAYGPYGQMGLHHIALHVLHVLRTVVLFDRCTRPTASSTQHGPEFENLKISKDRKVRSFHSEARWGQQEPCRFQWLVYNRCAPWNSQELMIFFLHRQCGWSTLHADPCLARLGPLMVFVGYQVLAFCDWQRRRCVPGVPGVPLRHVPSIPSCSWKV